MKRGKNVGHKDEKFKIAYLHYRLRSGEILSKVLISVDYSRKM